MQILETFLFIAILVVSPYAPGDPDTDNTDYDSDQENITLGSLLNNPSGLLETAHVPTSIDHTGPVGTEEFDFNFTTGLDEQNSSILLAQCDDSCQNYGLIKRRRLNTDVADHLVSSSLSTTDALSEATITSQNSSLPTGIHAPLSSESSSSAATVHTDAFETTRVDTTNTENLSLVLQIMQIYCEVYQKQQKIGLTNMMTEEEAIVESKQLAEQQHGHQAQLESWASDNGYYNLDPLVRQDGNCGADSLALHLMPFTSESWQESRESMSHTLRIRLAQFLRQNTNTLVPGYFGLTFEQLPRPIDEEYLDFCDRMSRNGEHLELAMFAAFAILQGRRIRIITSTSAQAPFETVLLPDSAVQQDDIVIGNRAMQHYIPFSTSPPLPSSSHSAPVSSKDSPSQKWESWLEPLTSLVPVTVHCVNDTPHLCDTQCPVLRCERCKRSYGKCFFSTQISRGSPPICIPVHDDVMISCIRCRVSTKKGNKDGSAVQYCDQQEIYEWDDAYHLAGFALNTKQSEWYTALVQGQYFAVKNKRLFCACSNRRKRQSITGASTASTYVEMNNQLPGTALPLSNAILRHVPLECLQLIQQYNGFHSSLFDSVVLDANSQYYMISSGLSTPVAFSRVSSLLDHGFLGFQEFQRVLNGQALATCEQARKRGVELHDQRAIFHLGSITERNNVLIAAAHSTTLKAVIDYDLSLINQGYVPVLVEQAIFSTTHGLAGTPDVVFYKPGQPDAFLITDLKYSRSINPLAANPRPCNRFTTVFGDRSSIFDTSYHKYGMQLNAYKFLLHDGGYLPQIRSWFGHATPNDALYSIQLQMIVVHDSFGDRAQMYPYDVQSTTFCRLLDSWLYAQGRPELTQRAIVGVGVENALQKLPEGISRDDTVLGALLSSYTSGVRRLADEQYLSTEQLEAIDCKWSVCVQEVRCTCSATKILPPVDKPTLIACCDHPPRFIISEDNFHNHACQDAAAASSISQKLSPQMRDWCRTAFRAGFTVHQIEQVFFSKNYPLSSFIQPPPRPLQAWEPAYINLRRFTPTTSALRSIEQLTKKERQFDPDDQRSVELKLRSYTALGAFCGPFQRSECNCAQINPKRPVCINNACASFRTMWMANWQLEFFKRPYPFLTVFIDGTGQVSEYGYQLISIMVINPETMRGIPIAHMVSARVSADDLCCFLTFVRSARPDWSPQLCIIDKDLTEYNGIREFAAISSLNLHVFICFFHVQKAIDAWMVKSDHGVPKILREYVHVAVRNLYRAKTTSQFQEQEANLMRYLNTQHPRLHDYFQQHWFCGEFRDMWSLAFVPYIPDYVAFTNNYIESWHKLLKDKALRGKHNRRLDKLIDVLMCYMHDILFRALYGRDTTKLRIRLKAVTDRAIERRHCVSRGDEFTDRENGLIAVVFGGERFPVRLAGFYGDGPFCPCASAEPTLCIHILIAILGTEPTYTFEELQAFGFVGTRTACLYRTLRGTNRHEDEAAPPVLQDGNRVNTTGPGLSEADRHAYRDLLQHLDHVFTAWHKLSPTCRRTLETSLWGSFRRGISEKQHLRRTRTGARTVSTSSKLARVRGPGRPKTSRQQDPHVSPAVLQSVAINNRAPVKTTSRTQRASLKNGQRKEAQQLIASVNTLEKLTVPLLKDICRAYGLSLSGTKADLLVRIQTNIKQ